VTWLAWRQFRTSALVAGAFLVAVALAYGLTGPHLVHVYDTLVASCRADNDCAAAKGAFVTKDALLRDLSVVLVVFPALLGAFWGAPLVARELENGTLRLAWTQSVTRRRWILTRLALVGGAAVVSTGLFSLMVTWWMSPFDRANDFPFASFDHRDIVPIGYALFAVMLGVAFGAVLRRTLAAMAATLFVFVGFGLFVTNWVRPRLATPLRSVSALVGPFSGGGLRVGGGRGVRPGDWITSSNLFNAKGEEMNTGGGFNFNRLASGRTQFVGVGTCPNKIPGPGAGRGGLGAALNKCVASFHLRDVVTYQPASRFWMFQWEELALYVVVAVLLGAFSYWWVRRRLS
jgi:ABC-2 family transporter protein